MGTFRRHSLLKYPDRGFADEIRALSIFNLTNNVLF